MGRGREVTALAAGGLASGSRGGGWICHQPLEQGGRPCSFPLRKTDVLPPPARRTPQWITSSRAPPEAHLCWVLKPFRSWNSTNHACSPSAVGGAVGGTGYPPKQTHSLGPARLQQLWWERGNVQHSELGFDWALPAPLWGWAGAPQAQPSIPVWHSMGEMLPSLLCKISLMSSERIPVLSLNAPWERAATGIFRWCVLSWPCFHPVCMLCLFSITGNLYISSLVSCGNSPGKQVISVAGVCFVAVFSSTESQTLQAGRVAHPLWAGRKIYFCAPGVWGRRSGFFSIYNRLFMCHWASYSVSLYNIPPLCSVYDNLYLFLSAKNMFLRTGDFFLCLCVVVS